MQLKAPKFSTIFIGILVILNVLPIIAPILMHYGHTGPAKVIYFVYSFFCHQMSWRSVHVYDHQCAWCARDMAIWGSILFIAVLIRAFKLKGLKIYHIIPFIIPIGLDGGIQTLASIANIGGAEFLYVSTNFMRTITGSIFGIGVGLTVIPIMNQYEVTVNKLRDGLKVNLAVITAGLIFSLSYFLSFVGIWNITSEEIKPRGIADHAVKLDTLEKGVIVRRGTATCPVLFDAAENLETKELLGIDCFFE